MPSDAPRDAFAVAAPGLESIVLGELVALRADRPRVTAGGVEFRADRALLYRAHLHLRAASRVLVRVARFRVLHFSELVRRAGNIAWESFVAPGGAVQLRVTCRKSRLYHSDAVAERVANAITARTGATVAQPTPDPGALPDEVDQAPPAQLFVIRLDHDVCAISADASGAHLHQRGYRRAVTAAPMRETLAAALLLSSGWDGRTPLLDPFCGSGTIPIEAALLARRRAPGLHRTFRFHDWPDFDAAVWHRVVNRARERELPRAPAPILGADRSAGAVRAALGNAARAGVEDDVAFSRGDARELVPPAGPPGWVVTNPPYGVRLGGRDDPGALYEAFGKALHERFAAWHVGLLLADPRAARRLRLTLRDRLRTTNGGIPVRFRTGLVGEANVAAR